MSRHRNGTHVIATDHVAQEWPVALVFNGISHAVMMATPRELEALAVGIALTEGLVRARNEIVDIDTQMHKDSVEVQLTVVQQAFQDLKIRCREHPTRGRRVSRISDAEPAYWRAACCRMVQPAGASPDGGRGCRASQRA